MTLRISFFLDQCYLPLFLWCFPHSVLVHYQVSLEIVSLEGYAEHFNDRSVVETLAVSHQVPNQTLSSTTKGYRSSSHLLINGKVCTVWTHRDAPQAKYKPIVSTQTLFICFITDFAPKLCFCCCKQQPRSSTKLCDFHWTEAKYISGELKKRCFSFDLRRSWRRRRFKRHWFRWVKLRFPSAHIKLSFSLWNKSSLLGKDGYLLRKRWENCSTHSGFWVSELNSLICYTVFQRGRCADLSI